mmetsp:Transcript_101883/g.287470  ORF Transcript_101883/g.287470 Transcript_101883/m.287470 type:complete len:528 (-) Transcript_101883:95-1678(-)|eukprot:CAMPEP_0117556316 /NCGR_PEP_ID=MMETSP0784-20121206/51745_1 /TAXON_ID=39447 /ORGANISM="" /LENGTH=527 /DNA_ID=CAMNT_0005353585 /DNA_START=27 /DNA_END=1610 /DNA_ORIENTATION=-
MQQYVKESSGREFPMDHMDSRPEIVRHGTHKGPVERMLLSIRSSVTNAVDRLGDRTQEVPPTPEDLAMVLADLRNVEKGMRSLELELGKSRLKQRGRHSITGGNMDDLHTDTHAWLVKTFTEQHFDAANFHHEAAISILRGSVQGCARSLSMCIDDEITSVFADAEVSTILERAGCFDFDAIAFGSNPKVKGKDIVLFGGHILRKFSLSSTLKSESFVATESQTFEKAVLRFFAALDLLYKPEAIYHGRAHAVDVMSTCEWFIASPFLNECMTPLDHFMTLVAAALHDVGHPGKNNMFLINTMDALALRYNDKSVLENMHVALAFETLQASNVESPDYCNWYDMLGTVGENATSQSLKQYVRKGLVDLVLKTDMAKHAMQVTEVQAFAAEVEAGTPEDGSNKNQKELESKLFLLGAILHAADISNPCKPQPVMLGWTNLVLQEFWAQGDEEQRRGLSISPLCDRASGMTSVPAGQLGFIKFVVDPYFSIFASFIPETKEAKDQLDVNAAFWEEQNKAGKTYEQIFST